MPTGEGKVTLSAAVPIELKERIQDIANKQRWTLSQTMVVFLEEYLEEWEKTIGEGFKPTQKQSNKQNKRKTG
jgi:hypothetical protein